MFDSLKIHGTTASILWGYRAAVVLNAWAIVRVKGQWTLSARIARVEPFMVRQRPLLFTAPREGARDGFWAWGVQSITVAGTSLIANLGPPEQ
jgi:hypothetical protein